MGPSKYISYAESVKSDTAVRLGIENEPHEEQWDAMCYVGQMIFDKVRMHIGAPLGVTSFFRSIPLNRAIGGSKTSQHCKGQAIDIDADVFGNGTNRDIFFYILGNLKFDQLIWEYGTTDQPAWVHVSSKKEGTNRGQVLRVYRDEEGKSRYIPFDL